MGSMSSNDPKVTGEPTRRPKQRRMRDMAMSMAVLLVPLGIFFALWDWASEDRQVSVADTSEDYLTAESLGLEVIRPDLSEDWKPISSALDAGEESIMLRTGWYSPDGGGLQLVQTTGDPSEVYEQIDGGGREVEAGGVLWSAYDTDDGEAWATELAGTNVVLTADADGAAELPELAEGVAAGL